MSLAVVTSIYGGFDRLVDPPPQTVEVDDWVCVTDDADLRSDVWRIEVVTYAFRPGEPPRLSAKFAKAHPDSYTEADRIVRMNGATYLKHERSLELLLADAGDALIAQYPHPARDCIYTEVEAAATQPKYVGQPLREQILYYRQCGHPKEWGLWETGVLVYNHTYGPQLLREFGNRWLAEMRRWSLQDQLSEPVILRQLGLRPAVLSGNYWDNPVVGRNPHLIDEG